jgi:hypothetical protein
MMKIRYSQMIEQLTGRKGLAFLSQAHVDPDLTIEVFLVDGARAGFGASELVEPGSNSSKHRAALTKTAPRATPECCDREANTSRSIEMPLARLCAGRAGYCWL